MTLGEACKIVGVGGKVVDSGGAICEVTAIGKTRAMLMWNCEESSYPLEYSGWSPHTEPKRVVLEYWQNDSGFVFTQDASVPMKNSTKHEFTRRKDLPNLVIEEGKGPRWEFEK